VAVDVKTMEVKKNQQLIKPVETNAKAKETKAARYQDFLGDVKSEFKKISWTSPEELKTYTKIVVVATFLLGMGIYIMDLAIQFALNALGFLVRLIS
jgi:preprotein translocase subunit SecE